MAYDGWSEMLQGPGIANREIEELATEIITGQEVELETTPEQNALSGFFSLTGALMVPFETMSINIPERPGNNVTTKADDVPSLVIPYRLGEAPNVGSASNASTTATRPGRLGNTKTQNQISTISTELESRGWTITGGGGRLPEEYLPPIGGGRKGGSYVDITAARDNTVLRVNTVDVTKKGQITLRELNNAARIRSQTNGSHLLLIKKK